MDTARILDVSANRAREALRVLEDYARFVLNDAFLTGQLKQLRHDLAQALSLLPESLLLESRDTFHDVGTEGHVLAQQIISDSATVTRTPLPAGVSTLDQVAAQGTLKTTVENFTVVTDTTRNNSQPFMGTGELVIQNTSARRVPMPRYATASRKRLDNTRIIGAKKPNIAPSSTPSVRRTTKVAAGRRDAFRSATRISCSSPWQPCGGRSG